MMVDMNTKKTNFEGADKNVLVNLVQRLDRCTVVSQIIDSLVIPVMLNAQFMQAKRVKMQAIII